MDCEQFDQIVMDLLYGEMAGDDRAAEARRHAERCERCSALMGDMRATRKAVVLPIVEPPSSIDAAVLEAARLAQKEIPWPRRVGRWVSWAGSYAMRPQLAMAALLLLMIGSSLLLIRGRPGSERVGVLRVTEQGVPEREGAETITPDPTELPLKSGRALPGSGETAADGRERVGTDNGGAGPGQKGGPPAPPNLMDEIAKAADAGADGARRSGKGIESPTGDTTALQNNMMQQPAAAVQESPGADGYAQAMELYKANDFANAYRAFDVIAIRGGANAPSAALYAAKAVRNSSGCTNALPRFESVAARYGASGAGVEAKWEAATCARIMGDFTRARILYRELAAIASQRERAERELARISSQQGQNRAAPARSREPDQRDGREQRPQQSKDPKKPPDNADAFDNAY